MSGIIDSLNLKNLEKEEEVQIDNGKKVREDRHIDREDANQRCTTGS
jgi:hypothetical protein